MKLILKENNRYVLRFDKGEEFIETLREFVKSEAIRGAYFSAIGASYNTELAYFNGHTKEYSSKQFKEPLEIVNVTGNVSMKGEEIIVHAHGVLGNKDMQLIGGHVNSMVLSTIAEVILTKFDGEIKKEHSEEIGLNIFQ